MRLRPLLFLLALLFAVNGLFAQTIQGHVADVATGKPLCLASVVNERTRQSTTTNTDGYYSLIARQGDRIRFSNVGYNVVVKITPPSVLIANVEVTMEVEENQLKEFTFKASKMSKYQLDSIERQETYHTTLSHQKPSPFTSPVSAIAEMFSKRAKRVYKFQEDFARGEIEKFVDTKYYPGLVTKLTGLSGDSIGHFMYAHPMPHDYARTATDLEIKMWIRSSYKEWLKSLR